jgi:hypothetical protein
MVRVVVVFTIAAQYSWPDAQASTGLLEST